MRDADSNKIERIQKTCLKVILGDMYMDYSSALEMTGLDTLQTRRLKRCLNFSLKSVNHPRNHRIFPLADTMCTFYQHAPFKTLTKKIIDPLSG